MLRLIVRWWIEDCIFYCTVIRLLLSRNPDPEGWFGDEKWW